MGGELADTLDAGAGHEAGDHVRLPAVARDNYVIHAEIARGGMGRVLSARDRRLGRPVAIKQLLSQSSPAAARFEREARITGSLQHPSIVPLYEAGTWENGEPFYAMKKVDGRPLSEVIKERESLEQRLALLPNVIAVADALAYAHSRAIIHRDLKPSNVLIGAFGETVVIDWGLAKKLGSDEEDLKGPSSSPGGAGLTVEGAALGTPTFMAPEQARGEDVDERTDVYALGAMLYHVLVGRPPYAEATTADDALTRVLRGPPKPAVSLVPSAPADLLAIVDKAMARDPEDRYPTAAELAVDLRHFETGKLVAAHSYSAGELIRRWMRRHRALVTVVAAALVLAVAGAALFLVRERRLRTEVQASFDQLMQQQLAVAEDLLLERIGRLGRETDQLASSGDVVDRLDDADALARGIGEHSAALPAALVQVFDAHGVPVAERAVGGDASRFANARVEADSPWVRDGLALGRRTGLVRVEGGLAMRAVAPIVGPGLSSRGAVALTVPLDGELAATLKATVGADVVFLAVDAPVATSLVDDGGTYVTDMDPGVMPPDGTLEGVVSARIGGRDGYALAVSPLAGSDGALLGGLGIAVRRGASSPRPSSGARPDTVVVARPADAITLDPARALDNESVEVLDQVFEGLITADPATGELRPCLAESWSVSADGRVWTFQLRHGVRFHDGTTFDADAVVFSFERQRDPEHPQRGRGALVAWDNMYRNIARVEKTAPYEVEIEIERSYAVFETQLARFSAFVVSPAAARAQGGEIARDPVGTGPYRLESWRPGHLVLTRNPDYWGTRPEVERLVFEAMPDTRRRLLALDAGEVDVAKMLTPEQLDAVANYPHLVVHSANANMVSYVALNTRHPPFDDPNVRRAINYAVDKAAIVALLYQHGAELADSPLPASHWAYRSGIQRYEHDPQRARALLDQAAAAGTFDREREYTLYVPAEPRPYLPRPLRIARAIADNLAEVGLRTRLVVQPLGQHLTAVMDGKHDLCLLGWVSDNDDPDNTLYVLLDGANAMPGVARNVAFWSDPRVHELLKRGQETYDRAERRQLYGEVQDIFASEAPWVPLAHPHVAVATRAGIYGMVLDASGDVDYARLRR